MSTVTYQNQITESSSGDELETYPDAGEDWDTEGFEDTDLKDAGFGEADSFGDKPQNVTRDQIIELFHKVDAKNGADEKDLLDILRDALTDEALGQGEKAWGEYEEVLEKSGVSFQDGEEGPTGDPEMDTLYAKSTSDEESETSEEPGDAPSRTLNGEKFYEGSGQDFDLRPTFETPLTVHTVKTDGTITLTPASPSDTVSLSNSGGKLVVQIVHEGKQALYKIDSAKASEIHIAADPAQITGNAGNESGKIKVGAGEESQIYISEETRGSLAEKLRSAGGQIGFYSDAGFNWLGTILSAGLAAPMMVTSGSAANGRFAADSKEKAEAAKEIVKKVAEYVGESDPEKKAGKRDSLLDTLSARLTSSTFSANHRDDIAQVIFEALYQGLGEEDLRFALKNEIFPKEFVEALSTALVGGGKDATSDDYKHVQGNSGMTHQASADFLRSHADLSVGSSASPEQAATTD